MFVSGPQLTTSLQTSCETCRRHKGHNSHSGLVDSIPLFSVYFVSVSRTTASGLRINFQISYVYWIVHLLDNWIKRDQLDVTFFFFSFHYLMLNMFRILIHPSSGVCDLFVELFLGLYCSVMIKVFALAYLFIWLVFIRDVCGYFRKQVTSSWSLFIQLSRWRTVR